MTAAQSRSTRHRARLGGGLLIVFVWLCLTAAWATDAVFDGTILEVAGVLGAGLILWGSVKTKVERLENEVEKRLTRDVFVQFHQDLTYRLGRIEDKMDGLPCRDVPSCRKEAP